MAVRTTESLVEGIIETEVSIPLDPFIEVANALVNEVCLNSSYTETYLELIERWLAAHFYAVRDNRRDTEQVGSVRERFQYKVDLDLRVTIYGQQALLIDFKGNLRRLTEGTIGGVDIFWLGSD